MEIPEEPKMDPKPEESQESPIQMDEQEQQEKISTENQESLTEVPHLSVPLKAPQTGGEDEGSIPPAPLQSLVGHDEGRTQHMQPETDAGLELIHEQRKRDEEEKEKREEEAQLEEERPVFHPVKDEGISGQQGGMETREVNYLYPPSANVSLIKPLIT